MPEQLVPETRLERFLSSIVYNTDVPDERRNRLELWLGAILKRNPPPDAPYDRLERWLKEIYENADYTAQFSGLNVEFWSGSEKPISSIELAIPITREGSGTPSPSNFRHVVGFVGADVNRYGASPDDNPLTVSIAFGRSIGDGVLDITSGILTTNYMYLLLDGSENWGFYDPSKSPTLSNAFTGRKYIGETNRIYGYCNMVRTYADLRIEGHIQATSAGSASLQVNNLNTYFGIEETLEAWKTFLSETPLEILYLLNQPVSYSLTPSEVMTLVGYNHLSAKLHNGSTSIDAELTVKV